MAYSEENKQKSKKEFLEGATLSEIALKYSIGERTLYNWVKNENWNDLKPQKSNFLVTQRLSYLLNKERKSELDFKELAMYLQHCENMEKIANYSKHSEKSQNSSSSKGRSNHQQTKGSCKNNLSEIDLNLLKEKFFEGLFDYQKDCFSHIAEKIRNILKARQIGMTYYFAREAFYSAVTENRDKIFISASKNQVAQFRKYIKNFVYDTFGIDLIGTDKIEFLTPDNKKVTMLFLATNARTAQSYSGDLYIDEYFWIPKFKELRDLAMGMASQKKWRITFFSTPSSKTHEAYPFWSLEEHNEKLRERNKPIIDFPTAAELKKGITSPDLQWRKVITIIDAKNGGCNLFNLDELQEMFSIDAFKYLFMCQFIDDGSSCFTYKQIKECAVNTENWNFDFAKEPVWIGFDPSRTRDNSCIVVCVAPKNAKDRFYVVEKITLQNKSWEYQADMLKSLCSKYIVDYLGIDSSGLGSGVFELAKKFYPKVTEIKYNLDIKTKMVLKAQQIIQSKRVVWDVSYSDLSAGFLLIKRSVTPDTRITYRASRSDKTGHADAAWALMHCFLNEELGATIDDECVCSL